MNDLVCNCLNCMGKRVIYNNRESHQTIKTDYSLKLEDFKIVAGFWYGKVIIHQQSNLKKHAQISYPSRMKDSAHSCGRDAYAHFNSWFDAAGPAFLKESSWLYPDSVFTSCYAVLEPNVRIMKRTFLTSRITKSKCSTISFIDSL